MSIKVRHQAVRSAEPGALLKNMAQSIIRLIGEACVGIKLRLRKSPLGLIAIEFLSQTAKNRRRVIRKKIFRLGCLASILVTCHPIFAQQQEISAERIQAEVIIVPVEILVTNKKGEALTDLRAEEFTILEDGRPQEVVNFSSIHHGLPIHKGLPNEQKTVEQKSLTEMPSQRRTFVIVLGRGAHIAFDPIKYLIGFVREDLFESDRVAVVAYNRSTGLLSDRESISRILAIYREEHQEIEAMIQARSGQLTTVYAIGKIPEILQSRIDRIFDVVRAEPIPNTPADPEHKAFDRRAIEIENEEQKAAQWEEFSEWAGISRPLDRKARESIAARRKLLTDLSFREFMQRRASAMHDLPALQAAIDYLRFVDGERHILYFSGAGLLLPTNADVQDFARRAADAQVRIHCLHTGGTRVGIEETSSLSGYESARKHIPVAASSSTIQYALSSLKLLADLTGGLAFIQNDIDKALARVSAGAEVSYILGYRPERPDLDGRFRKIEVRVSRKNSRLYHRQGYHATPIHSRYRQGHFRTYTRIISALQGMRQAKEIKCSVKAGRQGMEPNFLNVHTRVLFESEEIDKMESSRRLGAAFFLFSKEGELLAERWKMLTVKFPVSTNHQPVLLTLPARFAAPEKTHGIIFKLLLYELSSDRLSACTMPMQ